MTVAATSEVRYYPFPGFADPSLPAGSWAGVVVVIGDASGGERIGDLIFAPTGQALSSRMYSLEQVAISDENVGSDSIILQSVALGKASDITFDSLQAQLALVAGDSFSAVSAQDLQAIKGWFLGRQNRNSVPTSLRVSISNSNGDNLIFQAEGYWWDARSLNVRGGPSRPISGMYK